MFDRKSFFRFWVLVSLVFFQGRLIAAEEPAAAPSLSLESFGRRIFVHDAQEPLLLTVVISNPRAANQEQANERIKKEKALYEQKEWLKNLSEEEKKHIEETWEPREAPAVKLGGNKKPLADLLTFRVNHAQGAEVALRIRLLPTKSRLPVEVNLGGSDTLILSYGIETEEWDKIQEGQYQIQAILNTENEEGMWRGKVVSTPLEITLKRRLGFVSPNEANWRDYFSGKFYLLDRQYEKVEPYARQMFFRDHDSIEAWILRGDALDGQEKYEGAEKAFEEAIRIFRKHHPILRGAQELPEYSIDRLQEIRRKRGAV